jgi:hypothetical protein
MTWLLLDADMLLYQTVAACEVEIEWSQDIITTHLPIKEAQYVFNELLDTKKRQSNCERFTLCWTADQNFRKELVSTYKGNHHKLALQESLEILITPLMKYSYGPH